MRKLVGICLIFLGAGGLSAQEFSVFYIASANGTLSWCRCPEGPYGGLPRRASAIKEAQGVESSLLILDAGDILAPFPSRTKDSVFVEVYRRIPIDAVAFGDQELIEGFDFFARRMKNNLPFISLNTYREGRRLLKPYIVKQAGGVRIVITSLINKDAFLFYEPSNLGGVELRDPTSELRSILPELKQAGDVIVLLSHLGFDAERKIAAEFSDIDIIISGQTPAYLPVPEKIGKTFILGAGADAKHFGLARFKLEADSLVLVSNEIKTLSDDYPEESSIQRIIAPYIEAGDVEIDSALIIPDTQKVTAHSPVSINLFYAPDCDHCIRILKVDLPRLAKRYPGLFTLKLHNIDKTEEFFLLEEMEARANDLENDIPVLFFEDHVLGGEEEVKRDLERLLLKLRPKYSAQDSVRYSGQEFALEIDTAVALTLDSLEAVGKKEIVFFETFGCQECDRALSLLKAFAREDSTLVIRTYSIEEPESKTLLAAFGEVYDIPKDKRLLTPVIFFGRGYLLKSDIHSANLKALLEEQGEESIPWEEIEEAHEKGGEKIIREFKGFRILPIIGAGLIDGINPCAFATLIFFITYLSVLGVHRRRVIWVAVPFIAAVFATYFLLGFLAYQILALLSVLRWVSIIIVAATIVFLLVLTAYSFNDFLLLKRGEGEKIKLKLPDRIRKRLNQIIRKRTTFGGIVIGAVVTGFFVSLFELICTGQVYLPTLVYVVQVSEFRGRALLYLLLYNIAFIIPLIVIFILVRFGMTERHFQTFLTRHAALTKLLTAILFIVLAGLMVFFLLKGLG
ncbi:MAG: hypothetical protein E3J71_06625 [Candidatus Stahlbacteria bacterium]|nr:MAG: hypothetical protein E3J71_06625 [Candidatus Stahlbacteria bacterium]